MFFISFFRERKFYYHFKPMNMVVGDLDKCRNKNYLFNELTAFQSFQLLLFILNT